MPTLLVCTMGGTPEAVAAAVKGSRPDRVVFFASPETKDVEANVVPLVNAGEALLGPGQYDVVVVPDSQDLAGCVERARGIASTVDAWLSRGGGYSVVVDITGGTKCMAASLALVARTWRCHFSYVGGDVRNKGGVGVVVSGTERCLHTTNPWDSLGYQAAEEATALFDNGDYQAAVTALDAAFSRVERSDLRSELGTLKEISGAYLAWDLFDHTRARSGLERVLKRADDLRHALAQAEQALDTVRQHIGFLGRLRPDVPSRDTVLDLLANARRCGRRGRYDDGVARLYRAIEAVGQIRLKDVLRLEKTGTIALKALNPNLQQKWSARAKAEDALRLGLQEDFELLHDLGDGLATTFERLGLAGPMGALQSRNNSILAHGFQPVGQEVFNRLWSSALEFAGAKETELSEFPRLGGRSGHP